MVFFEAPHRLAPTLADLVDRVRGRPRGAAVCRELTKTYEEVRRGTLAELAEWAAARCAARSRSWSPGADPRRRRPGRPPSSRLRSRDREAAGQSRKDAIAEVAKERGLPKRDVFDAVVANKTARDTNDDPRPPASGHFTMRAQYRDHSRDEATRGGRWLSRALSTVRSCPDRSCSPSPAWRVRAVAADHDVVEAGHRARGRARRPAPSVQLVQPRCGEAELVAVRWPATATRAREPAARRGSSRRSGSPCRPRR